MYSDFQIDISSKEIFVLAGFLGYETVFGIDEYSSFDLYGDIKKQIKNTVRQLERKRIIQYDLDGTLFIKPALKICIECICKAEVIGMFTSNIKNKKYATTYIFGKNETLTLIERSANGKYHIQVTDNKIVSRLIPKTVLTSSLENIREKMLLEEAFDVQEQIMSFNEKKASSFIRKCVTDAQSVPLLTKILSGRSKFLNVQIHKNNNVIYKTVFNTLITILDNKAICVSVDENDIVSFYSVNPEQMYEQIEAQLRLEKRGGG